MTQQLDAPAGRQAIPEARPVSAPHAASFATTTGITAVITGVLALSVLAQGPSGATEPLQGLSALALIGSAGLLYAARNAIGRALDQAADPSTSGRWAARAMRRYHAGMAGLFMGLALAAAWRLGASGWAAALVGGGWAALAAARAYTSGRASS